MNRPNVPSARPRLIAFDLDATLWVPEMYELPGGAPFRRSENGGVYDCKGELISLMGASKDVLRDLATDPAWEGTEVSHMISMRPYHHATMASSLLSQ